MSTSFSFRQQFGAFCTNVPLGVRTLLEAPGLTTTLTAPKNGSVCVYVCPPLGERVSSTGSTVRGVFGKSAEAGDLCVSTPGKRAPFTFSVKQGGREDLQGSAQRSSLQDPRMRKLITSVYLLVFYKLFTPLFHFLFHGPSCFQPQKPRFCS